MIQGSVARRLQADSIGFHFTNFPLFLAAVLLSAECSLAGVAFSQIPATRIADYTIDVELNPQDHTLDGSEILTWNNTSAEIIDTLYFHMYPNAYKSNRTTYMQESGRTISSKARGWIDLLAMTDMRTGEDLMSRSLYVQPDDDNPFDSTVLMVQLTKPVAPRDSIKLKIRFHEQLPEGFARSGWAPGRQFYFVAQWFPKIGVFEGGKWNCHQFHAFTEFFSDFGTYDVSISVPLQYIVGATGVRVGEEMTPNGTMIYHYVADSVHDFAWAASPDFVYRREIFKYPGLPQTQVILLLQPEHAWQEDRYFAAIDTAIKYFGLRYGPYPYPVLTVVDPPRTVGVGGMEYPTLITAGTHDYTLKHFLSPEIVTIHEFGHQYWYGMVASNEFEEAWLDEGLNSYSTGKILEKAYGPNTSVYLIAGVYPIYLYPIWEIAGFPVAALIGRVWIHEPYNRLPLYLQYARTDAISQFGYKAYDRGAYRTIAYNKPELVLSTLEGVLGAQTMGKVLRTYFQEFKFKHPTAQDFEKVCEEVSGKKLNWFFDQFIRGTGVVDFAVKSISYYEETDLNSGASTFVTKVVVLRNGEVKMPVDLKLSLDDGSSVDTVWNGQNRWQAFEFRTSSAPGYAQLDPFHKIPIDINYANNSMTVSEQLTPVLKWVVRVLTYFQHVLLNTGVID